MTSKEQKGGRQRSQAQISPREACAQPSCQRLKQEKADGPTRKGVGGLKDGAVRSSDSPVSKERQFRISKDSENKVVQRQGARYPVSRHCQLGVMEVEMVMTMCRSGRG
jgi:hypothetical protein